MNIELIKRYIEEKLKWLLEGRPLRSKERMHEIYHDICSKCPLFVPNGGHLPGYDKCGVCQCNLHPTSHLLNKIAWSTTQCPDNPPRWLSDVPEH